ncbi:MAG: hypothetical protein OHK0039_47850 [Bacteroidia bacterium]
MQLQAETRRRGGLSQPGDDLALIYGGTDAVVLRLGDDHRMEGLAAEQDRETTDQQQQGGAYHGTKVDEEEYL